MPSVVCHKTVSLYSPQFPEPPHLVDLEARSPVSPKEDVCVGVKNLLGFQSLQLIPILTKTEGQAWPVNCQSASAS